MVFINKRQDDKKKAVQEYWQCKENIAETFPSVKSTAKKILIRTLGSDDVDMLSEYFLSLSDETRRYFSPHKFDRETAIDICANAGKDDTVRFIAIIEDMEKRIVAYFIIRFCIYERESTRYNGIGMQLNEKYDCFIAPSISDSHQSTGVGSIMMRYILDHIKAFGVRRMVLSGGVQARNERAVHFYLKFGFRKVNEFVYTKSGITNYDMILDL